MRNVLIGLGSSMVLASTLATTGCGGGSNGATGHDAGDAGTTGSVTSLSGATALNALTTADVAQLCSDTYAYFGRAISKTILCKGQAITSAVSTSPDTDAQLQTNCTNVETPCLNASPASPTCQPIPSSCTATVAQYSACIADQATAFTTDVSALPDCATITKSDEQMVWAWVGADLPDSCTSIDNTCPTLNVPTP